MKALKGIRKGERQGTTLVFCLSSGDLSSISGSEDSDSASEGLQILHEERAEFEKPNRPGGFCPHRVLFQNAHGQFIYAYRCVLGPHQASDSIGCLVNPSFLYTQS
jgi:hypothetical protein